MSEGMKSITIWLPASMKDTFEAAANARAMTMSAWIREAIAEKLEREKDDEAPRQGP